MAPTQFNAKKMVRSLRATEMRLPSLLHGVTVDEARWKPASGNWSILEIVCHLVDEEVEDFRVRLQMTLDGTTPWPSFDPELWPEERKYQEQDFPAKLNQFLEERRKSLQWLGESDGFDWGAVYRHPKAGDMFAGDLLASWAAHDLLHFRQISKRLYELLSKDVSPYSAEYAGPFT